MKTKSSHNLENHYLCLVYFDDEIRWEREHTKVMSFCKYCPKTYSHTIMTYTYTILLAVSNILLLQNPFINNIIFAVNKFTDIQRIWKLPQTWNRKCNIYMVKFPSCTEFYAWSQLSKMDRNWKLISFYNLVGIYK